MKNLILLNIVFGLVLEAKLVIALRMFCIMVNLMVSMMSFLKCIIFVRPKVRRRRITFLKHLTNAKIIA